MTASLEFYGYRAFNAGIGVCHLVANPGPNDTNAEPLVTAASAQARIAELEAENESHRSGGWILAEMKRRQEAEARADRLARFGQHTNWELSHGHPDGEEEDGCWMVHSVNGGRNDREWTLIGRGETPDDAIRAALQQETQP